MMRSTRAFTLVLSVLLAPVLLGADDGKDAKKASAKGADAPAEGLTTDEILTVIRANLKEIRHCYEALLQASPNAAGKLSTNFVIAADDGRVASVELTSNSVTEDRTFGDCVTGKIKAWRFPKPRGGMDVNVNYPFIFNPL